MFGKFVKILALACSILLVLSCASALTISAPNVVDVQGSSTVIEVPIANDSAATADLSVKFFAPTEVRVVAPSVLYPQSSTTAKIWISNSFPTYTEITSTLEVKLGDEVQKKQITLRFFGQSKSQGNQASGDQNQGNFFGSLSGAFVSFGSAFFSFGSFIQETMTFSTMEWAVFIVLVIVAAVLLLAFIAKVVRRV